MQIVRNEQLSDHNIIAGLKAGGTERKKYQTKLYERFEYMIIIGARKYTLTRDRAASAYSDAIIATIKNIVTERFEGRSSLEHYVYRIFFNKCVDEFRTHSKYEKITRTEVIVDDLLSTMPDKTADIVRSHIRKEQWAIITKKLAALGRKCYDILMLWGNSYSDQEIADMLEYRTSKVARVSRVRCLKRMQEDSSLIKMNHE